MVKEGNVGLQPRGAVETVGEARTSISTTIFRTLFAGAFQNL